MKKTYRIELNEADSIFTDCVLMASMSNGNSGYTPLSKIADHAEWLCKKYPASGSVHTVNRISDYELTIDKGTGNILAITEVEILELNTREEITAEEARGLLNEHNPELLN